MILQRNEGKTVYHNYTAYLDGDGRQRMRWMEREFVPNIENVANFSAEACCISDIAIRRLDLKQQLVSG